MEKETLFSNEITMRPIDIYRLSKSLHRKEDVQLRRKNARIDPLNRMNDDDATAVGGQKQKQKEPSNKWASITRAENKFDVSSQNH